MARAKGPRGAPKRPARKGSILDGLKPEEAQAVLRRLLTAHPELSAEAEQATRAVLGEVSFEALADEVEDAVCALDLDDLNGRAGRHSWGYVEPGEAALELLGEAVDPFLEDMKRHLERGLEAEALEVCKGIVLGLYRVRNRAGDEFLGWAPDFPEERAAWTVKLWRAGGDEQKIATQSRGGKRPALPQDFVKQYVPEWDWLMAKHPSRS